MQAYCPYLPSAEFVKNAAMAGMAAYYALCKEAETDYEGYWARLAKELISWKTPFTQVLDESNAPFFKWFADGTLNASYNCLDRNVEKGLGDKTAIIFEADGGEVTKINYKDLLAKTMPDGQWPEIPGRAKRVTAWSSTFPCLSTAWPPCRPAPVLVQPTRWCLAASRPSPCVTVLKTPVPSRRHHRRPPGSRWQATAPEVHRGRSTVPGRLRFRQESAGGQALGSAIAMTGP
jgi:hypothetical protein